MHIGLLSIALLACAVLSCLATPLPKANDDEKASLIHQQPAEESGAFKGISDFFKKLFKSNIGPQVRPVRFAPSTGTPSTSSVDLTFYTQPYFVYNPGPELKTLPDDTQDNIPTIERALVALSKSLRDKIGPRGGDNSPQTWETKRTNILLSGELQAQFTKLTDVYGGSVVLRQEYA